MGTPESDGKGPIQGSAAVGFDAPYMAVRPQAEAELAGTLAGPDSPDPAASGVMDPEEEVQTPARMPVESIGHGCPAEQAPGPNGPGNSACDGSVDPEGQQGGTHGGSPARPIR
jgi:hypothetical protein